MMKTNDLEGIQSSLMYRTSKYVTGHVCYHKMAASRHSDTCPPIYCISGKCGYSDPYSSAVI